MRMSDLVVNQKAKVSKINLPKELERRLLDLGLVENTTVECILIGSNKRIKAYDFKGTLIALRNEYSSRIKVVLFNEEDTISR